MCKPPPCHPHTVPDGTEGVQCGPDVQNGFALLPFVDGTGVVIVDDVPHLGTAAIHNPVVPVKRQVIAHEVSDPGSGSEIFSFTSKTHQRGATWTFLFVQRF